MADAAPASRGGFKQGFGGAPGGAAGGERGGRGGRGRGRGRGKYLSVLINAESCDSYDEIMF